MTVWMGGGDDDFEGGTGNDTINGGVGNDTAWYIDATGSVTVNLEGIYLYGSKGMARFLGNSTGAEGNDTLLGVEHLAGSLYNDTLTGDYNDNRITGFGGDDTLSGHGGNDTLYGNEGADSLDGGLGNDVLYGGIGGDILVGGMGADQFLYANGKAGPSLSNSGPNTDSTSLAYDTIVDWSAEDLIYFDGMAGIAKTSVFAYSRDVSSTVAAIKADSTLSNAAVFFSDASNGYLYIKGSGTGTSFDDTLIKLSGVTSMPSSKQLWGIGPKPLNLTGTVGNDVLNGQDGADSLDGGVGNDTLFGGMDGDYLVGGIGDDQFRYVKNTDSTSLAYDTISDWSGGDNILFAGMVGITAKTSAFAYSLDVTSTIAAIKADSTLSNAAVFFTDASNGYLYIKGSGTGTSFDDTLIKLSGVTSMPAYSQLSGVVPAPLTIIGSAGDDVLNGWYGADSLDGGLGNDTLRGGSGSDYLTGGEGNDSLDGQDGADSLDGGLGNDTLEGGNDSDYLTGGMGSDLFLYQGKATDLSRYDTSRLSTSLAYDTISDWSADDRINFSGMAGIIAKTSAFAFNRDVSSTVAAIKADSTLSNAAVFFTDASNGYLYIKGSGTGTSFDDSLIKLNGVTSMPSTRQLTGVAHSPVTIIGSVGNDVLNGQDGADSLDGGLGNDTLEGGWGSDYLTGGMGSDLFLYMNNEQNLFSGKSYSSSDAYDTITDWSAEDVIRFDGMAGITAKTSPLAFSGDIHSTILSIYQDGTPNNAALWKLNNVALFFTDSTDGYLYIKGDGTGTSFNGVLIKLSGVTSMPSTRQLQGVSATPSDEMLYGGVNNDTFNGGSGDDTINGRFGIDASIYSSVASNYTVIKNEGTITVTDKTTTDGVDTLIDIERLRFSDVSIAFDVNGNAGTVAKVLGAVFGADAVSNAQYVGVGLKYIDDGMSYQDLMHLALSAKLGAGVKDPSQVVNLLYTNIAGVAPNQSTLDYFVNLLNSNQYTDAALGVLAADNPLNAININLVGLAQSGLQYV